MLSGFRVVGMAIAILGERHTNITGEDMDSGNTPRKKETDMLIDDVRKLVSKHLSDGIHPSDLTYSLSFVAADLGLQSADNQVAAISVFNAGLSNAIRNSLDEKQESQTDDEPIDHCSEENKSVSLIH
jgi:hypothetical protein